MGMKPRRRSIRRWVRGSQYPSAQVFFRTEEDKREDIPISYGYLTTGEIEHMIGCSIHEVRECLVEFTARVVPEGEGSE